MKSWETLRQTSEFDSIPDYVPEAAVNSFKLAMGDFILDDCHGFWLEPESGDGHCDPDALVVTIGQRISALCTAYNVASTQSPIEDMLLGALLWIEKDWSGRPEVCYEYSPEANIELVGQRDTIDFWIRPQAKIGAYRADFLLWFSYKEITAGIVVECDGHAFHERTKEQASRDKKRDREILGAGYPVIRFTGSDIYKSPTECAEQVRDLLGDALDRVTRAAGLHA